MTAMNEKLQSAQYRLIHTKAKAFDLMIAINSLQYHVDCLIQELQNQEAIKEETSEA